MGKQTQSIKQRATYTGKQRQQAHPKIYGTKGQQTWCSEPRAAPQITQCKHGAECFANKCRRENTGQQMREQKPHCSVWRKEKARRPAMAGLTGQEMFNCTCGLYHIYVCLNRIILYMGLDLTLQ